MDKIYKCYQTIFIRWFCISIPLLLLTVYSCSNDDDTTLPTDEYITISPHIGIGVSRVVGNSFEENDAIGLYVVPYEDDNTTPGNIENPYEANVEHIYQESSWLLPSGGKLPWPSTDRPVDLYSYYPYDQGLDNSNPTQYSFAVSPDQRTKAGYEQSDFLWARVENVFPTRDPVGLLFSHQLSKVKVNVRSEIDIIEEDIRNGVVSLLNVISGGSINLADGNITIPDNPARNNILAYKYVTPELNYLLSAEAIVIPQVFAQDEPLVRIELPTNGTRYHYITTNNISFEAGMERTINITITQLGLSVTVGEINDWQPSQIIEGEIGTRLYRVVDISDIDWNASFIHHVYSDGLWVADLCREYLNMGNQINAQAIVMYTINSEGSLDISTGYVVQVMNYNSLNYQYTPSTSSVHGGRVNWAEGNSIASYTAGSSPLITRILLNIDGSIEPAPDTYPANMQTIPYRLTDIDGNNYALVKIGKQFWMKENLNVTHYKNGEPLTAYNLNDNPIFGSMFGKLYTWYDATNTYGIAPDGWRMPAYTDFTNMYQYIQPRAGSKLKANLNWINLGQNNNDITGYSGMGSGMRDANGAYQNLFTYGYWWTTTLTGVNAQVIRLFTNSYAIETPTYNISNALSIRLLRE